MVLALLSVVTTLAALARMRRRVARLRARARGEAITAFDTGWDRLIDRLAPGPVMINTFPRMSLMTEFMELTGEHRAWIQLPTPHAIGPDESHGATIWPVVTTIRIDVAKLTSGNLHR